MKFGAPDKQVSLEDFYKLADRAIRAVGENAATPEGESSTPKLTVETYNNHVYFYADVDSDRCLAMIKAIRDIDNQLRNERETRSVPEEIPHVPVWLHIQSNGGSLFTGLSMADQLATIRTPIYSIVEGCCASAATLISMSCTKRFILANSFMLIHQLSSMKWGKYDEFQDEIHLMDMLMDRLGGFYTSHSKLSKTKIKQMLQRDSWFDAEQCLKIGLVDEVLK